MKTYYLIFLVFFSGIIQGSSYSEPVFQTGDFINESELTINDGEYGVVNVSVADARMKAGYPEEMATQLLLRMPLKLLQYENWWKVLTPEGCIAWVESSNLVRMNKESFNRWTISKKVIFTDDYGFAYEKHIY